MRKIRFIRTLSFFDSVMLGVGFIIGSGIFIMPLVAAQAAGTYSLLSWVLAGVYSILTGLAFAECAAKIPKAGGLYTYAHKAFGDFIGFLTGWTFWLGYWITISTETWAVAWYLKFLFPQFADLIRVSIATLIGLILTYINFRGVKSGGRTEDIFTVVKLLALFLFVLIGISFFKVSNFYPLLPAGTTVIPAVGSAIILALWAYLGAEIITVPEEEIKNAKKSIPKAIIISVLSVMAIYLLISGVFLGSARWENYSTSQSPLADVFRDLTHSQLGGIIMTIGALVSIIGALNAVILASARISFAMSRDKLFPKIFSRMHKKYKTPYASLFLQIIFAGVLTFVVSDFVTLASLAVLFTIIPYALSSFATIKLVRKAKGELRVLHSKIAPVLAGLASLALIVAYWNQVFVLEIAVFLIFVGLLIFIERKKIQKL
jgi:amino acid transporter